uniref:Uncharacterized protein n=1 Tax=Tanacetum cinerariifolium TaxID=118510 RepID=A0A699I2J5_TANCI|nr:hypothetical protein [Tanacetum cinerariifolium]
MYFLTEPTLSPQHIDEFDLNYETSLSEYDEVEQTVLYFNDLFPFNITYPDDLKSDRDNDDNEIDMIQSSKGNENTQGLNNLLEGSHDKINKVFIMQSFIMELNVNIVAWNYFVNEMLFNLIKNLYMSFHIPFDPKQYYKDGVYTRMLRRPRYVFFTLLNLGKLVSKYGYSVLDMTPLPPRDHRHLWLHYQVEGYTEEIVHDFEHRLEMIFGRDPVRRLYHTLISYIISKRGQAHEKVTSTNLFYLRSIELGAANVSYLLAQYLFSDDRLRGLSVMTRELPFIDMGELVKLKICMEVGDDWAWVAQGTGRKLVDAAATPGGAEDAPNVDAGA